MSAAAPPASIVVPTRDRAGYLDVALRSFMPQAADAGAEVIVVVDGYDPESVLVAQRRGAHVNENDEPHGPNAARNTG
jgi:glycosyltransferase involved in cell wall biosynthesis